ncbi:hypothetical protein LEP1GSC016_2528 [Leptospira borgpetersenii serovar Hardjo-bovis str. Sponselee]|uniref:Uncharacterized protein n=2 Tax=Leptospira borgpetersenii TaxID=174 RepID=M6BW71_LEPBO|nr:hypothetical protein LEP1GSC082_3606 [Leptospira kirschneri str. H2]EMJ82781.1 hypothetical protein LEP1GSC016_2528 [Leptospira borgpetersenii serovar Hardjo-bovis str. Sponselee]EMN13032.1 hypothetical protein LEP1GSC055_3145 [Leptospira borgpetersenii str. Brem 307]EMN16323.1 hypothetical protein LEP1GSC056_3378 [Leptospira borgpetersenii str. Brem 328]
MYSIGDTLLLRSLNNRILEIFLFQCMNLIISDTFLKVIS